MTNITQQKTATFIRTVEGFRGLAKLYKVEPTQIGYDFKYDYVVVSAVVIGSEKIEFVIFETYIFPAGQHGNLLDLEELDGSSKGTLNHTEVLQSAGYEVILPAEIYTTELLERN